MYPDGTDDCQEQGEARWEEAKHLVTEAHGLSRGQSRIPQLEDAVAGRQRLLEAAVLGDEVLIKINFSLLRKIKV